MHLTCIGTHMAACAPVIGHADLTLIGACHAQIGRAKHLTFTGTYMAACPPPSMARLIGFSVTLTLIRACHAQIGRAKHLTFTGALPHPPPPVASLVPGSAAYKAQIDQVLDVQAMLTDVQKIQVHRT